MARGVNKVILIGNLGADPEVRFTAQGAAISNLNIATDESYRDKQSGQIVPKTEWHRVVLFNRLAEIARDYLKKGSKVYLEGKLQTRKWQDQSGQDRYTTEIVGMEMQMLDSKPGSHDSTSSQAAYGQQQTQQSAPQQNHQSPPAHQGGYAQASSPAATQAPQAAAAQINDFDDDIPF